MVCEHGLFTRAADWLIFHVHHFGPRAFCENPTRHRTPRWPLSAGYGLTGKKVIFMCMCSWFLFRYRGISDQKGSLPRSTPPSVLRVIQNPFGKVIFVKKAPLKPFGSKNKNKKSLGVGTIIQFGPCGLLVPCFSLIGVFDQHCARVWPLRSSILAVGES